MASPDSIRKLAEPLLAAAGLELWDVEIERDTVRILVDRSGGVDLEVLTQASAAVSPALDDHPELTPSGQFQLEVSSPGVERTLRTVDQYQRYVGQLVSVKTASAVEGSRRWHGRLIAADPTGITLTPGEPPGQGSIQLRYDQIQRARTVADWGPAPGTKGRTRTPSTADRDRREAAAASAPTDLKDNLL